MFKDYKEYGENSSKVYCYWKLIKMKILIVFREIKRNWNKETVDFLVRDK